MDFIESITSRINASESQRKQLAEKLKKQSVTLDPAISPEPFLTDVEPVKINSAVAGVDGGLLTRSFHGSDIVLSRAVAAVLTYENGVLTNTNYYPSASPKPEVYFNSTGLEREEVSTAASLFRLTQEMKTAIETIQKHKPKYLLIDGSLVPQNADKPRKDSQLSKNYQLVISLYNKLYETAKQNGTTLIGVVEDSRATRLMKLLKQNSSTLNTLNQFNDAASKTIDTHFLYYLLTKGQRTFSFSYATDANQHNILRDLNPTVKDLKVLYLKTVQYDRPLRLEFFSGNNVTEKANEVTSIIYSLSYFHKEYGCPTPIIEADLRAKLSSKELDVIYQRIYDKVQFKGAVMKMRRNTRPF